MIPMDLAFLVCLFKQTGSTYLLPRKNSHLELKNERSDKNRFSQ